MNDRIEKQMSFLLELDKMKNVFRRSVIADCSRKENDAEHSWHIAAMAITLAEYAPKGTNAEHAAALCIMHDLVEIYAGDTFCYDVNGNKDKEEREKSAADKLFGLLPKDSGQYTRGLWEEFENCQTNEAKFANALDRLEPTMLNYHTDGATWKIANPTEKDVLNRLSPVKEYTPALYDYCLNAIKFGIEKGYIKK